MSGEYRNRFNHMLPLFLLVLVFLMSSFRSIDRPGLFYDEAFHSTAAIRMLRDDSQSHTEDSKRWWGGVSGIWLAGWRLPIMTMEYAGSLKSYLLAATFRLLGISVSSLRLTTILVGALALLLTYVFTKMVWGDKCAIVASMLFATDPSFIMYTRSDWGIVALAMALKMGSLCCLALWRKGGQRNTVALLGAGLLLGIGVYDKATFVWFVNGLIAFAVVFYLHHENKPTSRQIALGVAAFLVGSSLFWTYNMLNGWETFTLLWDGLGQGTGLSAGFSLDSLATSVVTCLRSLRVLLNSSEFGPTMFGTPVTSLFGVSGTILPLVFISSAILLVLTGFLSSSQQRWKMLVLPILMMLMLVQMIATPFGIGGHHLIMLYPLPHIVVALAAVHISRLARSSLRIRFGLHGVTAAMIGGVLITNLATVGGYWQLERQTGGIGFWSDAVYDLAEVLMKDYKNQPIYTMDWGFNTQLVLLSRGELTPEDTWWRYMDGSLDEHLLMLVSDERSVFLIHSEQWSLFPEALHALDAAAQLSTHLVRVEMKFYQRDGQHLYSIVTFQDD